MANDTFFKGFPYPITSDAQGYFGSVTGVDLLKGNLLMLLLTNPGERCFTGDTKISLANGEELPIKELVGSEPFWVYSYDGITNSVVPGLATAHKTVENAELIEVTLDNGEKVRCTPNHLWLLRDGNYRHAEELQSGDSLMSLYGNLNHKVANVERIVDKEDCYDLTVETYHNFALSAGVFVHNCMLPEYGTPLNTLLFDPNDATVAIRARQMIIDSISQWEPRIVVDSITVSNTADRNTLSEDDNLAEIGSILTITIEFRDPVNITETISLELEVPLSGS